jgi:hypothetical protein
MAAGANNLSENATEPTLWRLQGLRMPRQVLPDKARDKVITLIIAFLHPQD